MVMKSPTFLASRAGVCLLLLAAAPPADAWAQSRDNDLAAVRAVVEAQAAAWNRGDVVGYMDGYAKEESTTFVSGGTVTRGWQRVLDRYKASYDTRDKMGTLAFTDLEFTPLCQDAILATGRWQLTRGGGNPNGRFTLLFRPVGAGWRIVYDHTSSSSSSPGSSPNP